MFDISILDNFPGTVISVDEIVTREWRRAAVTGSAIGLSLLAQEDTGEVTLQAESRVKLTEREIQAYFAPLGYTAAIYSEYAYIDDAIYGFNITLHKEG